MSQQNVERVRQGFDAWQAGDLEGVLDLVSEDLVFYRADPDGATFHGKDGLLSATAEWAEGFEDWTLAAEEFIDAGEKVLVRVLQTARGEGSGAPVEGTFWFVYTFSGSKVSRWEIYARESQALEAAGLSK